MNWKVSSSEPAISATNVSKRFRVTTIQRHATLKEAIVNLQINWGRRGDRFVQAVDGVTFSIPRGASVGIVGRNGSGKSTLLRLLAGVYAPDAGSVRVIGTVAPLLTLGVGFHPEMSGRENLKIGGLVLGLSPRQVEARTDEIIDFAELREFIDAPIRTYSSGMHMRLAFSVAISIDPDVLLVDEVLAVGDEAFAAKCHARLKEFKDQNKTTVLVTHSPVQLLAWCETTIWMDRGSMRLLGPTHEVLDAYHRDLYGPSLGSTLTSNESARRP